MPRASRKPHCALPSLEALEDRLAPAGLFGQVVVFGDSLTDVGNAFAATGGAAPASPPYFHGRFSNGPVFVETLAEYLGKPPLAPSFLGGTDYAVGGASVLADGPPGSLSSLAPKVPTQVAGYLLGHAPAANDLFVFLGGANDFFDDPFVNPADVAGALAHSVEGVIAAGGDRFLVGNLPLLGEIPLFASDPTTAAFADQWTLGYNAALDADLAALRQAHPGITLLELDVQSFEQQALAPNNPFGFTRGKVPLGPVDPSTGLLLSVTADDPDQHLFADALHPTARAHQIVGVRAAAEVLTAFGANAITVTNTSDALDPLDGGISLREALALSNEMPGRQSIRFDLGPGPHTIHLGGTSLTVSDSVIVAGPQSSPLTIDAGGHSRIFDVATGAGASLSDLTLTGGRATQGGAIRNAGRLVLSNVSLAGNAAVGADAAGGAVYNTGSLTVLASVLSSNTAQGTTSAAGGAIANAGGDVTLIGVTLLDDVASAPTALGGALANLGGTADVLFSAFEFNRAEGATARGGAIYDGAGSSLDLLFSLVSNNTASGGEGGGLYLAAGADADVIATLIVGNAAWRGKNVFRE
jgi:phospholipase/lecithinase/hemolysin